MDINYKPSTSSFSYTYARNGKTYTAVGVNEKLTFTKYN